MTFRFAVGEPYGPRSCSWKLQAHRADIYLLQRNSGKVHKFSFHKSGICRWALIGEALDGRDRCALKWNRDPIPEANSDQGRLLMSLAFPANHLSAWHEAESEEICWIKSAPAGHAVGIDIVLVKQDKNIIERLFREGGHRELIFFETIHGGTHICVSACNFDCGPIALRSPGKPPKLGQVFGDLVFPDFYIRGANRPVRMLMLAQTRSPPIAWELGGYEESKIRA